MHNRCNPKLILYAWYMNQSVQEAQLLYWKIKRTDFFKLANNCLAAEGKVLHPVTQDKLQNWKMMISFKLDCLDLLVP